MDSVQRIYEYISLDNKVIEMATRITVIFNFNFLWNTRLQQDKYILSTFDCLFFSMRSLLNLFSLQLLFEFNLFLCISSFYYWSLFSESILNWICSDVLFILLLALQFHSILSTWHSSDIGTNFIQLLFLTNVIFGSVALFIPTGISTQGSNQHCHEVGSFSSKKQRISYILLPRYWKIFV